MLKARALGGRVGKIAFATNAKYYFVSTTHVKNMSFLHVSLLHFIVITYPKWKESISTCKNGIFSPPYRNIKSVDYQVWSMQRKQVLNIMFSELGL